jgi:hypothetical protein
MEMPAATAAHSIYTQMVKLFNLLQAELLEVQSAVAAQDLFRELLVPISMLVRVSTAKIWKNRH